jgi:hypothetical protein
MPTNENLADICSVKMTDFSELFDLFFDVRKIDISSKIDFRDPIFYQKCLITKIEVKEWKTYDQFLDKALEKIVEYYLDWENDASKKNWILKQLNQYIPVRGISLTKLHSLTSINHSEGTETWEGIIVKIRALEKDKKKVKKLIENIPFEDIRSVNLESEEDYLLDSWSIRSARQILGYLHGDLWEFLLFFLVEWFLGHPVLFSKVRHCKSSPWDKVKWSDGIHIGLVDGQYIYNFLEAKITKSFDDSLRQSLASNVEFLSNEGEWDLNNEVTILFNNTANVDKKLNSLFENGFQSEIEPYLDNPEEQQSINFCLSCLLSYNCDLYWASLISGNHIGYVDSVSVKRVQDLLKEYKSIEVLLWWKQVNVFLFPLKDEIEIIKLFLSKIKPV